MQRGRADAAMLDNVRSVAERAAVAWGREAIVAEQREARQVCAHAIADLAAVQNQRFQDSEDRLFSENPDRSFAEH